VIDLDDARSRIIQVCRSMYERGYLVAGDGNVSMRVGDGALLVTPTRSRKGYLRHQDLVLVDLEGRVLPGQTKSPSSELRMHLLAYDLRPEIGAVVHAHPPYAVAHSLAGASMEAPIVPEAFVALGRVPIVPYATPTTDLLPRVLSGPIRDHDVMILERHGSLTLGASLEEAYDRLEILEHTAKMSAIARLLSPDGKIAPLSAEQIAALRGLIM
jgi:L-fuculose-phosphate aldolase